MASGLLFFVALVFLLVFFSVTLFLIVLYLFDDWFEYENTTKLYHQYRGYSLKRMTYEELLKEMNQNEFSFHIGTKNNWIYSKDFFYDFEMGPSIIRIKSTVIKVSFFDYQRLKHNFFKRKRRHLSNKNKWESFINGK